MHTLQKQARLTGFLYLIIIICAGFGEAYVRDSLIIEGNARATAENIAASSWLFSLGFASDLLAFMCDAAVAVLLYVLLKPVSKTLALVATAFRLIAHPAIGSINLLNHFAALLLIENHDLVSGFNTEQIQSLLMFFLRAHTIGYLIAGAFFGVHCFLLGILLYRSALFPRLLGILLLMAAFGYLIESFGNFLFPAYEDLLPWVVAIPAAIAEISLTVYLIFWGVKHNRSSNLDISIST